MRDKSLDIFIAGARKFLPESRLLTDRQTLAHYCYDGTDKRFLPEAVLLPVSTEEVSQVMRLAHELEVPVTPQGGRTGLSGGGLPVRGGVVLSFLAMNRILEIDEKNLQVVVEPGVVPAELQRELDARGLFFPPDPSSTVESTIGGNVAENAGYTRAVKYGVTRDYILGLEAVMPDGQVIRAGGRTVKDVTGYDLVSLLVGSEGTLAVITKIICRLLPKPPWRSTCVFYLDDPVTAAELVVAIFQLRIVPCAIEFMDGFTLSCIDNYLGGSDLIRRDAAALVLVEVDGNHQEVTEAEARAALSAADTLPGVLEARLAATNEEAERLWRVRREALPALKARGRDHLEADVVVPRYRLPSLAQTVRRLAEGKRVTVATYGHAGDGNLHVTIQYRGGSFTDLEEANTLLEEIYRETIAMDGRLTGEHGVGLTVKDYLHLQLSPGELALLRRIKQAFDPKNLLNPGKIFPDEEY